MANLESSEEKEFKDAVCDIRSASDYSSSICVVKEKLKLPNSVTDYEMEALLIHATREQFGESLDADMVLMALGLLKGFDNHRNPSENRSGIELVTVRRKMFLKMSSYVADRHNSNNKRRAKHYESYEELEAAGKDAIDAVVSALGSDDAARIKKVAKKIYSRRRSIAEYLKEANKYLIYDKKGNIVDVKLQELKNIRQKPVSDMSKDKLEKSGEQGLKVDSIQDNFPSATERKILCPAPEEDASSESDSSAGKTEESGKTEEQRPKEGYRGKSTDSKTKTKNKDTKDFVIKCSVVALAIITVISASARAFIIIHNNNVSQKAVLAALEDPKVDQKPYSILFTNPEEWLPFGKTKNLTVKPEPADATLDGLRCKSEGDNAHIIEILSEPGLHIKAIDESEDSEKCDVEVKAYMDYNETISDVVTIHVIKDGENEPMGTGVLDDKTSGNSSQRTE